MAASTAFDKVTLVSRDFSTDDAVSKWYVDTKVTNLVNSAPELLDTLGELASALTSGDNVAAALASTVSTLSSGLATETTERKATDGEHKTAIDNEVTNRIAAIEQEVIDRNAAIVASANTVIADANAGAQILVDEAVAFRLPTSDLYRKREDGALEADYMYIGAPGTSVWRISASLSGQSQRLVFEHYTEAGGWRTAVPFIRPVV